MSKIGFAVVIAAVAAAAPSAAEPRTATIVVSRADFASTHARAQLDRKIRSAIESVCGSYAAIESSQVADMDSCWKDARAQAETRLAAKQGEVKITSR